VLVVKVAMPLASTAMPLAIWVAPAKTVTVPWSGPPPGAVTLTSAVMITSCSKTVGLGTLTDRTVVVLALLTVWLGLGARLALLVPNTASPL
jgi:hypothetical protein